MIAGIFTFIILTLFIAAGLSIWSVTSFAERKTFFKLILKSAICSAIAVTILSFVVILF